MFCLSVFTLPSSSFILSLSSFLPPHPPLPPHSVSCIPLLFSALKLQKFKFSQLFFLRDQYSCSFLKTHLLFAGSSTLSSYFLRESSAENILKNEHDQTKCYFKTNTKPLPHQHQHSPSTRNSPCRTFFI